MSITAEPSARLQAGVSVVVPVYNSRESLPALIARLHDALARQSVPFEIFLVNDGSRDDSWDVITALATEHPTVHGVDLCRNHGQHNALLCGIRLARFSTTVTLDDDLQNVPEDVPRLLEALASGYDVVYGAPQHISAQFWRSVASRFTKLMLRTAMGAETADRVSTFRAFRTELRDAFAGYQGPFVNIDVLLTWSTYRFTAVTVAHDARRFGRSTYTLGKLFHHALDMVTGFSTLPLRLASVIGFGTAAFGGLVLIYVLGRYAWQGGSIPGFPFLASVIAIFSGAQLFAMGILGEYLARMFQRTIGQPCYTVRRTTVQGPR